MLKQDGAIWNDWRLWVSVIVGLGLRRYHLTDNSLWFDEGFSVAFANADVPALLHKTLTVEPHPPTYYLILHYWIAAFGASPSAIRMLSVIFGTATIFLVFNIGATLGDRRLGAVSSFLLAISPFHIQYTTEARMYGLLTFAGALSFWGAALFMRNMARPPALRKASFILVIGISLAVASHNIGVLVWAAISTTLLVIWLVDGRPRPALLYGLVLNGIIAILFLCWLPFLLEDWQIARTATNWMPPLGLKVAAEELGRLFAPKVLEALSYRAGAIAAAAVALIALLGTYSWRHDRHAVLFCVLIGIPPDSAVGNDQLCQANLCRAHFFAVADSAPSAHRHIDNRMSSPVRAGKRHCYHRSCKSGRPLRVLLMLAKGGLANCRIDNHDGNADARYRRREQSSRRNRQYYRLLCAPIAK